MAIGLASSRNRSGPATQAQGNTIGKEGLSGRGTSLSDQISLPRAARARDKVLDSKAQVGRRTTVSPRRVPGRANWVCRGRQAPLAVFSDQQAGGEVNACRLPANAAQKLPVPRSHALVAAGLNVQDIHAEPARRSPQLPSPKINTAWLPLAFSNIGKIDHL